MEASEHTFPLPEIEAHKLDIIEQEFAPPTESTMESGGNSFLQANKWPLLMFGALGIALGLALRKRR